MKKPNIIIRLKQYFYKFRSILYLKNNSEVYSNGVSRTTTIDFVDNENYSYGKVNFGVLTFEEFVFDDTVIENAVNVIKKLKKDTYVDYTLNFLESGYTKYGRKWKYADITTVLYCLSKIIQPENYLEIGVRKGRSLVMVISESPNCNVYGFDMWVENYAGIKNPGTEFIIEELKKFGHTGNYQFIEGDSHKTLKKFFNEFPDLTFDIITVDGDHTYYGAVKDLVDVIGKVRIGGAIVFDDISHPKHLYLLEVWEKVVKSNVRFSTWEYTDIGFGIAIAIRKY